MDNKRSRPLNLDNFEDWLEWDSEGQDRSNLDHCLDNGLDEQVVEEVLYGEWVNIEIVVDTAEFAIVGPNIGGNFMWTLLFATSQMRSDVLRSVTGWDSKPSEIRQWERIMEREWKGSRQKYPNRDR